VNLRIVKEYKISGGVEVSRCKEKRQEKRTGVGEASDANNLVNE
jgi:hypothetical protein